MKKCMGCMRDYNDQSKVCPVCGYSEHLYRGMIEEVPEILHPETILGGRFILGRALSSSDYSIVYIAWDALLQRRVAVKEYFPLGLGMRNPETLQVVFESEKQQICFEKGRMFFEQEADCLNKNQDLDALVNYYRSIRENGTSYVIMEYITGTTLQDFFDRKKNGDREMLHLFFAMLMDAVKMLHDRNLVHFNLTPDNVYIERNGRIRLLDPGNAKKELYRFLPDQFHFYRENFIAPEVLLGQPSGKRADLYSLGAIYYYIAEGKVPRSSLRRKRELRMKNKADEKVVNFLAEIRPENRPEDLNSLWQSCSEEERRRFLGYGQK